MELFEGKTSSFVEESFLPEMARLEECEWKLSISRPCGNNGLPYYRSVPSLINSSKFSPFFNPAVLSWHSGRPQVGSQLLEGAEAERGELTPEE